MVLLTVHSGNEKIKDLNQSVVANDYRESKEEGGYD